MPRLVPLCACLALLGALAAVPVAASGAGSSGAPVAFAARGCHLTSREQTGGLHVTYVLKLSVRNTSCRNGKRLVKAYQDCRHRHGRAGHCRHVLHYTCTERRYNRSPFSFDANARCTRGSRVVRHTYTQNL